MDISSTVLLICIKMYRNVFTNVFVMEFVQDCKKIVPNKFWAEWNFIQVFTSTEVTQEVMWN